MKLCLPVLPKTVNKLSCKLFQPRSPRCNDRRKAVNGHKLVPSPFAVFQSRNDLCRARAASGLGRGGWRGAILGDPEAFLCPMDKTN